MSLLHLELGKWNPTKKEHIKIELVSTSSPASPELMFMSPVTMSQQGEWKSLVNRITERDGFLVKSLCEWAVDQRELISLFATAQPLNTQLPITMFIHRMDTEQLTLMSRQGQPFQYSVQITKPPAMRLNRQSKNLILAFLVHTRKNHSMIWVVWSELHTFAKTQVSYFCKGLNG